MKTKCHSRVGPKQCREPQLLPSAEEFDAVSPPVFDSRRLRLLRLERIPVGKFPRYPSRNIGSTGLSKARLWKHKTRNNWKMNLCAFYDGRPNSFTILKLAEFLGWQMKHWRKFLREQVRQNTTQVSSGNSTKASWSWLQPSNKPTAFGRWIWRRFANGTWMQIC